MTNAERNELQNKIKDIITQRDSINNEYRHAVNVIKKLKKEKRETKELEKEFKGLFNNISKEKNMIIMVLMKMVFIKILVKDMMLTALIDMVFT